MSCVSAVHQSPRLAASRRVSMNSKALSAPPGNKNGTICLRCITPCHEGISCPIALSPCRLPSHYFTLKYISVFCIADTPLRRAAQVSLVGLLFVVGGRGVTFWWWRWGVWFVQLLLHLRRLEKDACAAFCGCASLCFALNVSVIKCSKSI